MNRNSVAATKEALNFASKELDILVTLLANERGCALKAAAKVIDDDLDVKYGAQIKAAKVVAQEAIAAHQKAVDEYALTGEGCPVPLGTKLAHWESKRYQQGSEITEYGIVEAVTSQTEHPSNSASYSRAEPGQFIVRILKKDGTIGIKYDRFGFTWGTDSVQLLPHGWKVAK